MNILVTNQKLSKIKKRWEKMTKSYVHFVEQQGGLSKNKTNKREDEEKRSKMKNQSEKKE